MEPTKPVDGWNYWRPIGGQWQQRKIAKVGDALVDPLAGMTVNQIGGEWGGAVPSLRKWLSMQLEVVQLRDCKRTLDLVADELAVLERHLQREREKNERIEAILRRHGWTEGDPEVWLEGLMAHSQGGFRPSRSVVNPNTGERHAVIESSTIIRRDAHAEGARVLLEEG